MLSRMASSKTRRGPQGWPAEKKYQRRPSAPNRPKASQGSIDVALGLGHLPPLLVHDVAEADHVAVGGAVEHQGVDGEQAVEPAARLVDGLADVVGGERRRPVVASQVVLLGAGHRARVEPGVEHRRDPSGGALAGRAREGDVVDERTVEVEGGEVGPGEGRQLGHRPHAGVVALVAAPDGQRGAPVAVAGQRPVDVGLEPLPEAAVLDVVGVPPDGLVLAEQGVAAGLGAGEPRGLGPVDERACRTASSGGSCARSPPRPAAGRARRGRPGRRRRCPSRTGR